MGMPADVIDHRRNGMLSDIDNVDQLVSAARTLIDDAECRARIGQAARETVLSGYDWSTILEQYRELLYDPLL
jgi:glycosyltransferase involved in cell wall biosynthesis